MKVKVEITVDVDARAWATTYGQGGYESWVDGQWTGSREALAVVREDVRDYVRNLVAECPAADENLMTIVSAP